MKDEEYIAEYVQSRGLSKTTHEKNGRIFKHYSQFQGKTLHELLIEAEDEEEQGIRWKRRTLKKRLINYMNHLKDNMLLSSAKTYFAVIKGFYNHHEIEIGALPKWNVKNANIPEPITPKDMLTKDIIREALKVANPLMTSIILTEASSGMTRSDVLSLSVGQFIEATKEYHHKDNVQEAVHAMLSSDYDIIPTFHLRRSKNNKYFITFISPEATVEICKYLQLRDKRNKKYHRPLLTGDDRLFKINPTVYLDKFVEINTALNRGKAGTYNQFRGHMLRKFHATSLEKAGMSRYMVRVLQGKSNGSVDDVYFIEDEQTLRDEYIKAMEGVLIFTDIKEITKYSPEYQNLETKYKEKEEEVKEMNSRIENIEKLLLDIDNKPRTRESILKHYDD